MSLKWAEDARIYEAGRLRCEKEARRADRDGLTHKAAWWRQMAETWRSRRDEARRRMEEDELDAGHELARELLDSVAHCKRTGRWPGAFPNETQLRLPPWAYPKDEVGGLGITFKETA